jgi:hypothetical protein
MQFIVTWYRHTTFRFGLKFDMLYDTNFRFDELHRTVGCCTEKGCGVPKIVKYQPAVGQL